MTCPPAPPPVPLPPPQAQDRYLQCLALDILGGAHASVVGDHLLVMIYNIYITFTDNKYINV